MSSNSAKKNMLVNNHSPKPHPSYSQHTTPKSNFINTTNNTTGSNFGRKKSIGAVSAKTSNSRYVKKVNNNNCMIGIGKGLPPG